MRLAETPPLEIAALAVAVYRAPIGTPVRAAMGTMTDRPAVVVRAVDRSGALGFGEVWCNFPTCGAEHRARLVETVLARLVVGGTWRSPEEVFARITAQTHRLVLQAGEPGPFAQAIAGIDTALWDLAARKVGAPLWRLLGGAGDGRVPAYASGINPEGAVDQALGACERGFRAFKLKVGFGRARDLENLRALREALGDGAEIAVDANQAWDLDEATRMSRTLAPFAPLWLEEPLAADRPLDEWRRLAAVSPIPLAAGENVRGDAAFDALIASGAVAVIQPDVGKWGGISGCLPLARRILAAGQRYCPHWLGGGIGLLASAHLLAAAGGDGLLEMDSNPNPLREGLARPFPELVAGRFVLGDGPGLGVQPQADVERYRRTARLA